MGHSGSPAMYNYSFQKLGLDYAYLAYDIKEEETEEAVKALRLLNVKGFNITMPCKTAALACCDELSKAAELIGAVNTVVNENGKLIGHNTDGMGCQKLPKTDLRSRKEDDHCRFWRRSNCY